MATVLDEDQVGMRSYECLLKEIEEKMFDVQNALSICETERAILTESLRSIRQSIGRSFQRHAETLQCRSKWLVSHAESIFHLKDGSLSQQVAELELMADELKRCLDASSCSRNERDDFKSMANTVLESLSQVSLQPCESGSMSFVAQNENLEQDIICFGDIDAHDRHSVTSASQTCVDDLTRERGTTSDMPFEWLHRNSLTDQVVPEPLGGDMQVCDGIKLEKSPSDVSDGKGIVPLWLKECREASPGLGSDSSPSEIISHDEVSDISPASKECNPSDDNASNSDRSQKRRTVCAIMDRMNSIFLAPSSKFLRIEVEAVSNSVYSLKSGVDSLNLLESDEAVAELPAAYHIDSSSKATNEVQASGILGAPNSSYLRRGSAEANGMFGSPNASYLRRGSVEANGMFGSPNASYLRRGSVEANGMYGSPNSSFLRRGSVEANGIIGSPNSRGGSRGGSRRGSESIDSNSIFLLNPSRRSSNQSGEVTCSTTMAANIEHIKRILSTPAEECFLLKEREDTRSDSSECIDPLRGETSGTDEPPNTSSITDPNRISFLNPNVESTDDEIKNDIALSPAMTANIDHINRILNTPSEECLLKRRKDSQELLPEGSHDPVTQSNIDLANRILDVPSDECLAVKDSSDNCVVTSTGNVDHMRDIESTPHEMFLLPEGSKWIRRSSSSVDCLLE